MPHSEHHRKEKISTHLTASLYHLGLLSDFLIIIIIINIALTNMNTTAAAVAAATITVIVLERILARR